MLKEFSISMNKIELIETGLDRLVSLEYLNMSKNRIENFKELLNLNLLPKLVRATFFDSHYGDNTICNLWNYQTYALYHLTQLEKLDTLYINNDAKAFVEATFMKKRMYSNMRIEKYKEMRQTLLNWFKQVNKIKLRLILVLLV